MKLGSNSKIFFILLLFFSLQSISFSEERIRTVPLINLEKIKPSFEDVEEKNETLSKTNNLKKKMI